MVAFGGLGALSILAHASGALFLLPAAIWLVMVTRKKDQRALLLGAALGTALLLVTTFFEIKLKLNGILFFYVKQLARGNFCE